jgi:hypothetical protein
MTSAIKPILIVIALLVVAWLGYRQISRWYLVPRREALTQITAINAAIAGHTKARQKRPAITRDLDAFVDRSLGGKLETVDHRLRTRLSQLAAGLQGVKSETEPSVKPRKSPAANVFRGSANRTLRDEDDFVEVEGSVSGNGTLEDVVRLIAAIEAEPWIKRIDQVNLDPRDNGERLAVNVRLTTLFLPGREPRVQALAGAVPAPSIERYAALVSSNPFRVPPPPKAEPPAAAAQAAPAAPPPTPLFPWNEWAVTGVAQGPAGPEAWLLHKPSGQTRVLGVGQALDAAVLTGVDIAGSDGAEAAEFAFGEQRFRVAVGATMDQRAPVSQ